MVRMLIGKLQKRFAHSYIEEEREEASVVPHDVKEGHFAVLAMQGSEKKRFVVKLECLKCPEFMRLLEKAEEEYGFRQTGTLVVPCKPQEFEKILKIQMR